ncbi:hypothetical protein DAETH_31800 [Deinococcus aetherius]|uniref:Alpha-amylase n=1 Tax=Deinococcus aetherius TaxID=200252 RepID=A0ABN6RN67_9DEIO|nr:carboxypeptidase-like regulatory domain-containing protein [Deinococcus aetherius]BDP43211.1 hypothetical protein DAETH_31800 [Deinococcus aetherius]
MRHLRVGTLLLTALLGLGALPGGGAHAAQVQGGGEAPRPAEAQPGEFLTVPLRLAGQPPGSYRVRASLPEGWVLLTEELDLEGGRGFLALHLPEEAVAGPHDLTFTLTGPGEAALAVPVRVVVAAHPDLVVTLPEADRVRPGERRDYRARVTNVGNARDRLRLSVEGSATVTPDHLTLGPGESAEVRLAYTQRSRGNADTVTLAAVSGLDERVRREALLVLAVGDAPNAAGGPGLTWNVEVAPELSLNPGTTAGAGAGNTPPTLPGLPTGLAAPAPATPAALGDGTPRWTWGGTFSAGVGGQLSDYASGGVSYSVRRTEDGGRREDGLAYLEWGDVGVTLRSRDAFSGVDLGVQYERGDYTFGVSLGREAAEGGTTYGLGASVSHRYGVSVSARHLFGEPGGDALSVGWTRRLGAWTPAVEVGVVRSGAEWGYALSQRLDYEDRRLLARQEYRYDSLTDAHALNVRVAARQLEPFGVGATLSLSRVGGVLRYDLGAALAYHPDEHSGVQLQANLGSDGPRANLTALRRWDAGDADLFLSGQASLAGGALSGVLQATAVLPRGPGEVLLSGVVGHDGGLRYGAGAGYLRGPFSVAGSVEGGAAPRATLSAAYRPERGLTATADYLLERGGAAPGQEVRGSVGYAADLWSAGLLVGYRLPPGEAGRPVYGAQASGQLLPTLRLQARAERSADRTRFTVGGSFTPGGSWRTPGAVVALFGGRNAGTLRLQAFRDDNANGARDPGEPGVASGFRVGGQAVTTDTRGEASLLLTPGGYEVQLGDDVPAQYLIPALPPARVTLRETTMLSVPVREVGTLQGRLGDEGGRPLAGVRVRLAGPGGTLEAVTDATGAYRLGGLRFGPSTLTVQPDPALYHAPPPLEVTLDARQPLVTQDITLRAVYEASVLAADDLTLEVTLPGDALPPGASLPVEVRVEPAADAVTLEGLGAPAALRSEDGRVWRGTVPLPPTQGADVEVQVTARRGERSASERALVRVDPALPAFTLQAAPFNALPGQPLTLRAVAHAAGGHLQVRDAQGRVTELQPTGGREFGAPFTAESAPGTHTLTLLVDGEARAEATYRVLGRP